MDKDCLKFHCQTGSRERGRHREKESYFEAPGAEVPNASIRRSSRLLSKKKESSCSRDVFKSYHSSSKYSVKSLNSSLNRMNSVSESKIGEDNSGNENNGVFSVDTASMKSSTAVPSFKYHVRAKDGIQLVVDLNLSRSDWLRSMEKAVCVCQNHQKPEFQSFRQEVEYLGDRNNLKISSFDKTIALDASMYSYVQNDFFLKSTSRGIGKTLSSVVKKELTTVSNLEFCPRDGYTKTLNSIVPDAPPGEPSSVLNMTLNGSKVHQSKNDQSPELVRENCGNTTVQENCSPNAECLDYVAFSSEEIQFSDFSSHQKGSSCSRTGKICSENLLTSTIEVNQQTAGNHRHSTSENGERANSAGGLEVSGREENGLVILASDDGPKRKKHNHKSDHIYGQCDERILRSTKLLGGQIFQRGGLVIRRSSRLLTKAVTFTGGNH